jgi:hypothetical protein
MSAILLIFSALLGQSDVPMLQFRATEADVIARLPTDFAAKFPSGRLTQEQGESILTVALVAPDTKKAGPPMIGKYERTGNELTFKPRFELIAGQKYRADYHHPQKLISCDYDVPAVAAKAPPKIVKVYPTTDVLPANHLKFYIYFDRPMRGGKELFKHLILVDDKGKEIDQPWLIDEIWDEENNCLILYIHPGRIKWGVELRELLGPVLYEKRNYSLIIRGDWTDLDGNKIGKDYVKKFRTTAEDRVRVDLSQWKLSAPRAGTSEALHLSFPKSIDHRSLKRFLKFTNDKGEIVEAKNIAVSNNEKTWSFSPKSNWRAGNYQLHIDGELEDVCGNTPVQPFDVDLKAPKLPPQKLRLDFKCVGD